MKKGWKIALCVLLAIVLLAAAYLIYVFLDYHRIADNQPLPVTRKASREAAVGQPYTLLSWNIGFGAYEPDYGFFMDGGTESWAWSEERLQKNMTRIAEFTASQEADIVLLQEVDFDSTRTYHLDETQYFTKALPEMSSVQAVNYDSPFLFYPFLQPHGASRSCIMTCSGFRLLSSLRRSLPIETGFTKFLDLDRCYSVTRAAMENGKELCIFNVHLSAYSSDGSIGDEQMKMLVGDLQAEYEKGNYCICAGDFNKDLLGDSSRYFGVSTAGYSWTQPIRLEVLDGTDIRLEAPLDETHPVASCRNADGPIRDGQLRLTVDGFLVSENVEVLSSEVIDLEFAFSDHNPVKLTFLLKEE